MKRSFFEREIIIGSLVSLLLKLNRIWLWILVLQQGVMVMLLLWFLKCLLLASLFVH